MPTTRISKQSAGGVIKSLNASTAVGAGAAFDLQAGYTTFSVQVLDTASTNLEVNLQGSLDGTNWANLGSTALYTSTAGSIVKSTSSVPVQYVRLNLITQNASTAVAHGYIGFA